MHALGEGLQHDCRVVVPDWPGFGDRPRPPLRWTPDALSAFLSFLVEQAIPPPYATVAAGHAAAYALHQAARAPASLGRLILVAPTWRGPLPTMAGGDRKLFHRIRRAVEAPGIGPILYRLNVNPLVVRLMVAGHVYSDPKSLSRDWHAGKRAVIGAGNARHGSAAFVTGGLDRFRSREDFLHAARSVGVPIRVIVGADTPRKSRAEMDALTALPDVDEVVLPRGKLGVHEEFPAETVAAIRTWLFPPGYAPPG
jgi:pimeloyl-ACP methyl ester carboxylesterase